MKMTKKNEEDTFSRLPEDIFFDILLRLPLKTISNCRWVNKTWYVSVLNPRFAQLHYAKSLQSNSICALFRSRGTTFHFIEPQAFHNLETSVTAYPLHFKEFKDLFTVSYALNCYEVAGSVNGLVCFSPETGTYFRPIPYYICNPITREYVTIPLSPHNDIDPIASGFGFDSDANVYKVIRILLRPEEEYESSDVDEEEFESSDDEEEYESSDDEEEEFEAGNGAQAVSKNAACVEFKNVVEVFTLGSDKWRQIPTNISYITGMKSCPVFVNGCLHWIAFTNATSDADKPVVVSFNLATEGFNVFQFPPITNHVRVLMVLENRLCFVDRMPYASDNDIWEMKDDGVQNYWVKKCTFGSYNMNVFAPDGRGMAVLRNGEILLVNDRGYLGYYNPQKSTFQYIKIQNLKEEPVVEIDLPIFQVGSLFSPKQIVGQSEVSEEEECMVAM